MSKTPRAAVNGDDDAKRPHLIALPFLGAVRDRIRQRSRHPPSFFNAIKTGFIPHPRSTAHCAPASMASLSMGSSEIAPMLPTPAGI